MTTVEVHMTEQQAAHIEATAAEQGMTASEFIVSILFSYA